MSPDMVEETFDQLPTLLTNIIALLRGKDTPTAILTATLRLLLCTFNTMEEKLWVRGYPQVFVW